MFFLHLVFCCLIIYNVSEGRIVQGIIGRNVSFSWTINNIRKDAILIQHDKSLFLWVWPDNNNFVQNEQPDRVKVSIDNTAHETITVTINLLNITKNDGGVYMGMRQRNSERFGESIILRTFDETMIPKVAIVGHNILDLTLVLECSLSSMSAEKYFWKVNGSLIENNDRFSQNNTFLSIRNLTVDDQYSLYKCIESGSGFESDSYNIQISGPSTIRFASNIMMIQEHSGLNVSCLTDCYPICSWKWRKLNPSSGREEIISAENTLRIQNITRQSAGKYSCRVQNKITGIALENLTALEIVYGPDAILFNSSKKTIQLNENDSITISCSADCFPPCQISWTKMDAEIVISAAELKLVSLKRNGNYTCHSTNPRKDNSAISDTIYVIVKSEISHYTTTTTTRKRDTEETSHYTTTALSRKEDTEGINSYTTTALKQKEDMEDSPSKPNLLYIVLGMGVILAVALIACLLHRVRICSDVHIVSNSNALTDSRKDGGDGGDENLLEAKTSGYYWTIVSDAQGELSTAIETDIESRRQQPQIERNIVLKRNESEQSIRPSDFHVNEELDGYITPIPSLHVELDYIHPIHSDPVNIDFVPKRNTSEQLIRSDDFQVNEEIDGCINPIHSRPVKLEYIHPIHSDPMNIDFVSKRNKSEQSVRSDDFQINEELDGCINPIHSRHVELEYVHPIHSDPVNIDFVHTRLETEV